MFFIKRGNKKGADKMLSMYWFVIVLIVSFGIFAMVYVFYSAPYEIREMESEILSNKIADCFSRQGRINPGIFSEQGFNSDFDLLRECKINLNVENEYDWKQEGQYFIETEFYSVDDLNNPKLVLSEGNLNWKPNCFIKDKKENDFERFVKCREERVYAVDQNSNQYLIKILVGVAKIEKNARQ
jgi:hypothetical protein